MKKEITTFWLFALLTNVLMGCSSCQTTKEKTTINPDSQEKVQRILEDKLKEYDALSGEVIVMETGTGYIRAQVRLGEAIDDSCSQVPRSAILLAALESGKIQLNDVFDTGEGIKVMGNDTIRDHNWHTGGYGKLTALQGFANISDITMTLIRQKAFPTGDAFQTEMKKIGFANVPYRTTDLMCFYNAIANAGKMISPVISEDSMSVVNPQIADKESVKAVQKALRYAVTDGFSKKAASEKVATAGEGDTFFLGSDRYRADFCGYFPADKPQYTVFVTLCKQGLPVSGSAMCGSIFKEIAEAMVEK